MANGIQLFDPLAEDYARYRPGYPRELVDELARICGLAPDWEVADIGSGTGNLARVFLEAGHKVFAVEPNKSMREAGERQLEAYTGFTSLEGTAEQVPLDDQSVDLVCVGQALHWFDVDRAKAEFRRILRPGGWVAVMWNERLRDETTFTVEYVQLASSLAVEQVSSTRSSPKLDVGSDLLFMAIPTQKVILRHTQAFDLDGLLGRARSSGFIPQPNTSGHSELTQRFTDLFTRHQKCGLVEFHYLTPVTVGRL